MQGIPFNKEYVLKALKPYLRNGYSIRKACEYIGINHSLITKWCKNDPSLSTKILGWQNEINLIALRVLVNAIENGNLAVSKYWLESHMKDEFSTRRELSFGPV